MKFVIIATTATILVSGISAYVWHEQNRPKILEVYIFALKSGRFMLIRTPDDHRILVDGGGNSEIIRHLSKILPFYSRRIDSIMLTNTDTKNISGLIDVTERYVVDKVYLPKYTLENSGIASSTDKTFETFLDVVASKKIETRELVAGDEFIISKDFSTNYDQNKNMADSGMGSNTSPPASNVVAQVIFPAHTDLFDYSKASAPELLFNIVYGNTSLLFMGDASKKVQKFVASSSREVIHNNNVIIVSHSGVEANISSELMNIVMPDWFIYEKTVAKSSNQKTASKLPAKSQSGQVRSKAKLSVGNSVKKKSQKKSATGSHDSLAEIQDDHRFNLKELGTVKIISNGNEVEIKIK
ncbi:MAG: hypothetical protein RL536_175 [Candidatus Parcubacteria bacterium]|jgi:beta-lactamase superfamily II metal-dependent hydrolase